MSKSKIYYDEAGVVYGFGELESDRYLEVDDVSLALEAFSARKMLRVVDGELVISESRDEALARVRQVRDQLLAESDVLKMKLEDSEVISGAVDAVARQHLAVYRQALRDVTLQDPFSVSWPTLEV